MSDPEYVKLAESRNGGVLADPISKWSISGANVLPFPTDVSEAKFVRRRLVLEDLEAATGGEYDDAHPAYPYPVVVFKGSVEPTAVQADTTAFWIDTTNPFSVVVYRYVDGDWTPESEGSPSLPSGIYVQSTAPSSPSNGNFWIDTSGSPVAKIRSSGSWVTLEIPSSDIPEGIFITDTEPGSPTNGDLWVTVDGSVVKLRSGGAWVTLEEPVELPAGLYVQSTAPSSPTNGNVWVDTTSGLVSKKRVSGSWVTLTNTVEVTQAAYDLLTPDGSTIYVVIG